jgi:hypothetical protein
MAVGKIDYAGGDHYYQATEDVAAHFSQSLIYWQDYGTSAALLDPISS